MLSPREVQSSVLREFDLLEAAPLELADVSVDFGEPGPLASVGPPELPSLVGRAVRGLATGPAANGGETLAKPVGVAPSVVVGGAHGDQRAAWPDFAAHSAVGLSRLGSSTALMIALGVAIPLALWGVPFLGELGQVVFAAALAGQVFRLVDHIARGRPGLALPDDELDSPSALVAMVLRAAACGVVIVGPAVTRWWGLGWTDAPPDDVLFVLAVGAALGPAVVATASDTRSAVATLNPFAWAEVIVRAGLRYLWGAPSFVVLEICVWAWWLMLAPILAAVPVVGPVFGGMVVVALRLVQAVIVGEMLCPREREARRGSRLVSSTGRVIASQTRARVAASSGSRFESAPALDRVGY